MKLTKNQKIAIVATIVVLILLFLFMRHKKTTANNGYAAGSTSPNYLTFNVPQPGSAGFTLPGFGNNYFGGINMGGSCNGCDTGSPYTSQNGLAQSMSGVNTTDYNNAVAEALKSMPGYMEANIAASYKSGSIAQGNYDALSVVPVLALGSGTTSTALYAPAGISGDV